MFELKKIISKFLFYFLFLLFWLYQGFIINVINQLSIKKKTIKKYKNTYIQHQMKGVDYST